MRAATATDLEGVVAVSRQPSDDPLMAWPFPDVGNRPRRFALWTFMGAEGYLPGGAYTVVPDAAGADAAALWLAPGQQLGGVLGARGSAPAAGTSSTTSTASPRWRSRWAPTTPPSRTGTCWRSGSHRTGRAAG